MLHHYESPETSKCLSGKRVIFMGDSTSRKVFIGAIHAMNSSMQDYEDLDDKHKNWVYNLNNVSYELLWDPYLNSDGLSFLNSTDPHTFDNVATVYISFGMWYSQEHQSEDDDGLKLFRDHLKVLAAAIDNVSKNPNINIVLSPVIAPGYDKLGGYRKTGLSRERIEQLNGDLRQQFPTETLSNNVYVPHVYNLLTEEKIDNYDGEGIHVISSLADIQADIMYNLACNTKVAETSSFPYSNTCCLEYPEPTGTYLFTVSIVSILTPAAILSYVIFLAFNVSKAVSKDNNNTESFLLRGWNIPLAVLSLVCTYSYVADRTQTFSKANQYLAINEFFGVSFFVVLLGISFLRPIPESHSVTPLNKYQTDEWKGWMQLLVLLYFKYDGSSIFMLSKFENVVLAAYLFIISYDHASYFIIQGDVSLQRALLVLYRLNMLPVLLAYVMNTSYQFYFFPGIATFWFLVVWATFRVLPKTNTINNLILVKVLVSGLVVYASMVFAGSTGIFTQISQLFGDSCDFESWIAERSNDFWAIYLGIFVAIYLNHSSLQSWNIVPLVIQYILPLLGVFLIGLFMLLVHGYTDRSEMEQAKHHNFLNLLPVIGFIFLRNNVILRKYHSKLFSWLGSISLEMFVLHNHIWCAADGTGILYAIDMGIKKSFSSSLATSLSNFEPYNVHYYVNLIIVTIVFIVAASQASSATKVLALTLASYDPSQVSYKTDNSASETLSSSSPEPRYELMEEGLVPESEKEAIVIKPQLQLNNVLNKISQPLDYRLHFVAVVVSMMILNAFW